MTPIERRHVVGSPRTANRDSSDFAYIRADGGVVVPESFRQTFMGEAIITVRSERLLMTTPDSMKWILSRLDESEPNYRRIVRWCAINSDWVVVNPDGSLLMPRVAQRSGVNGLVIFQGSAIHSGAVWICNA